MEGLTEVRVDDTVRRDLYLVPMPMAMHKVNVTRK